MADNIKYPKDTAIQIENIAAKILTSSRSELYLSLRYLDSAISFLIPRADWGIDSMGTDGSYLYYNPEFIIKAYREDKLLLNSIVLHNVLHCVLRHFERKKERDTLLWDVSSDIAIKYILKDLNIKSIRVFESHNEKMLLQSIKNSAGNMNAEKIYNYLYRSLDEENQGSGGSISGMSEAYQVDDHSRWGKASRETRETWERIARKAKVNAENWQRGIGKDAGALFEALSISCREKHDYREFLRKFASLNEAMRVDIDSFDYIMYNFGLERYGSMPLIEPLEYKEIKTVDEFVIAIDTSGSCEGEVVKSFLEECYSIFSSMEAVNRKINLRIIQCDAKIQDDVKITTEEEFRRLMDNFVVKGLGGTDFRPVFRYVDELVAKGEFVNLKGMAYFTDGYGEFPLKRPGYDVVFIMVNDYYCDEAVPAWASKIVVDKEDISVSPPVE